MVETQNNDGGWDWGEPDDDPNDTSPVNTIGVTAQGLLDAYRLTEEEEYMDSVIDAYGYMDTLNSSEDWRIRGPDITLLVELSEVTEESEYAEFAKTKYEEILDNYGSATDWAEYIRDARKGTWGALISWDINLYVQGALALDRYYPYGGYDEDAQDMTEVIYDSLYVEPVDFDLEDETQNAYWLSHTGVIEAFTTTDLHITERDSLKDNLLDSQEGSGCFVENSEEECDVQTTAYAIIALLKVNEEDAVLDAINYLIDSQLESGSWGEGSDEYTEVTSEAAQAIFDYGDFEGPIFGETTIEPEYPNCEDTLITISSEITDENGVHHARLYWKYLGMPEADDPFEAPQFEDDLWITQILIEPEDGREITYHIRAVDNVGNEEWSSGSFEPLFTYDCSPPETTLIIGDPSYNNYITSDTEIILTCTDAISGCDKTYYKIDDDDWEEYTEPISAPEGTLDGSYTIYYYSTDNAGNEEEEKSQEVILDNTAPEVTLEELDEFYNSTPIILNFTYSDSGSGVSEYKVYKKKLGLDSDFKDITSSVSCIGEGITTCDFNDGPLDGEFEFKVEIIDNVENSKDSNIVGTVLDRWGPFAVELDSPINGDYFNYSPLLQWLIGEDNDEHLKYPDYGVSGVKEYELIIDEEEPIILNELSYQTSGLGEGIHIWRARAWDNADNPGEWSEVRTFTIDLTPPEISDVNVEPYYEGSIYVAGIITASATVIDNSGVDSVKFSLADVECNAEQVDEDVWACDLDTITLEDGEYNLIVTAVDIAENEAVDDSLIVTVDNTAPTTTIVSPPESSLFASDFEVSVSDSDDGSGLNYCEYKVNEGSWTSRECNTDVTITVGEEMECDTGGINACEVEFKATDNLGNENEAVSRKFTIDFTSPIVEITNIQNGDDITCFQSVTASINDEGSGVDITSVYATITNLSGSTIANQTMVYDSSRDLWDTTFSGLCSETPVGNYTIEVVGDDIAGNSNSDEKGVYFPSVVAVFSEPQTCNVDSNTGGTCTLSFSFWIRGGNAVMMSMSDIVGAGELSPTEVNATIFNDKGSAAVGNVAADGDPMWNGGILNVNTPVGYFNLNLTLPANFTASTSVDYYIKPVIV